MLWVEGVALTVAPTPAGSSPSPYVLREDDAAAAIYERRPPARRRPHPAAPALLRPDHRRRHPVLEDRPAAPGLVGQHRAADLRLLGQRRPVHVLRHRRLAGRRPHDRQEDPGDAGRGGGRRPGPRRRRGRDADHRAAPRPRPGRAVRRPLRRRRSRRRRACRSQVQFEPPTDLDVIDQVADLGIDSVGIHVETFDPAVLARVAPGKARLGHRGTTSRAWERAVAALRRGPGVDLRHPRHGRGPRAHRRGLPAGDRHGRLPVRRPAAAGRRAA